MLFTEKGTGSAVDITLIVRCDLYDLEWYLTELEVASPLLYKELESLGVLVAGCAHVGAALIEKDAFDREVKDW